MRSRTEARGDHPDLLTRPPCGPRSWERGWAQVYANPIAQVQALADLRAAGLLTQEEFERHKAIALDL